MIRAEVAVEKLKRLGFECQQCGNCCLQLGSELELSYEETKRWEEYDDLVLSNFGYCFLSDFMEFIPELGRADLWFHPETAEELSRCPFLRKSGTKYQCLIYELRPDACKFFPTDQSTGEVTKYAADICPEVRRLKSIIEGKGMPTTS